MLNLLKMNLYYSIKTKSTWVLLILSAAFMALHCWMAGYVGGTPNVRQVIDTFQGGDVLIMLTIYTVSLAGARYKNGYIKNLPHLHRGYRMYLADLLTVTLFLTAMLTVILGTNLIYVLVSAGQEGLRSFPLPALGVQLLIHLALMSVVLFVIYLIQNSTACMTAVLVYVMILSALIWNLAELLVKKIFPDVSVLKYILTQNIRTISSEVVIGEYLHVPVAALAVLLLFGFLSVRMLQKRGIA